MPARDPENWLDELLPFPRPEYAKQTESLLTDLLWRSEGSCLPGAGIFESLGQLRSGATAADPERLVPRRRHGGSAKLTETLPLAEATDTSSIIVPAGAVTPTRAVLNSVLAPRARGDKSEACVPIHPSLLYLQTLHGLVNKESPANLALAVETMGWLGGAPAKGQVAASYLAPFMSSPGVREGATGFIDNMLPMLARNVWDKLPEHFQVHVANWPTWLPVAPVQPQATSQSPLSAYQQTPFYWFWRKWERLCDPARRWYDVLPARRYTDWALCLLRTGLAFAYLWEAEFFTRLHERIAHRLQPAGTQSPVNRLSSMFGDGPILAMFEPPRIPASQKGIWPATSELLARGWEARRRIYAYLDGDRRMPPGASIIDAIEDWVQGLSGSQIQSLGAALQTSPRMASNQKEFIRYLILERSSDDDMIDQADFYYLARSNSRHLWFHPGPEWLVVIASLLCEGPGGQCTLGVLIEDLRRLGVKVDRSVLVGLLEESGLSTDSPDADNALVIRSGF